MSDAPKANVQRFYAEAWNEGRFDVIDELFSADYIDHDAAAHTGGMDGRASARAFIEVFRTAIPDLNIVIEDQIGERDTVATRWKATGTHRGTLLGIASTGNRIEVGGISIDRFDEDGHFVEGWGNWDALAMLRQIGALPDPAS